MWVLVVLVLSAHDLTVWSLWRDNFDHYLEAHVSFYPKVWGAKQLWLNVGITSKTDMNRVYNPILRIGCKFKINDTDKKTLLCAFGRIVVLTYTASAHIDWKVWNAQKNRLFGLFRPRTNRILHVDHDEFFVPPRRDPQHALTNGITFKYHMIELKAVQGRRNWSQPFEWVDQPYYYKVACTDVKDGYKFDGSESTTSLSRQSHHGPFAQFEHIRRCQNISHCLYNHYVMWHIGIPSESYYVNTKHWDQTVRHPGQVNSSWGALTRSQEKHNKFDRCIRDPAQHNFRVFRDDFVWSFFQH